MDPTAIKGKAFTQLLLCAPNASKNLPVLSMLN